MTQRTFLIILLTAIFLLAGCSSTGFSTATDSVDSLVAQSDAVFLAQVSYISATKLDETSAEPYHQIAFSIEQAIVDDLELGSGIVMLVFGESPVADAEAAPTPPTESSRTRGQAVHQLKVGDSIVVFAKEGTNGNQTVIVPATDASTAFLATDMWEQVREIASDNQRLLQLANK